MLNALVSKKVGGECAGTKVAEESCFIQEGGMVFTKCPEKLKHGLVFLGLDIEFSGKIRTFRSAVSGQLKSNLRRE